MTRVLMLLPAIGLIAAGCYLPTEGKPLGSATETPTRSNVSPPTPSDFTIGVNIIEKSCFGDYGCNMRYRIAPNYTGATQPSGAAFTIVYTMAGCDGEKQASFEMNGDKWRLPGLDWDYCTSPTGQLSARVIQVLES